jgi:hypothetical protein
MSKARRLRNLGPAALLVAFLASTAFTFQLFFLERGDYEDDGGRDWFIAMSRAVVGKQAIALMVATLLLVRRDELSRGITFLFRLAALVALGQVVLALTWIAYEWRGLYNDGEALTQITMAFAAAILSLVALQPHRAESADGEQDIAVASTAGEFGGTADAAHQ